jgi:hypothetical protein
MRAKPACVSKPRDTKNAHTVTLTFILSSFLPTEIDIMLSLIYRYNLSYFQDNVRSYIEKIIMKHIFVPFEGGVGVVWCVGSSVKIHITFHTTLLCQSEWGSL